MYTSRMGSLRTKETQDKYSAYKEAGELEVGCRLCEAPALETFTYWKVVDNKFPYDKAASTHHMILPIEHWGEADLTEEAWAEFEELKKTYLNQHYEFLIEPMAKMKSIPAHFHLHIIVASESF